MSRKANSLRADNLRIDIGSRSYTTGDGLSSASFSVCHIRDGLYSILHEGTSISAVVQATGSHQLQFTVNDKKYVIDLVDHRLQLLEEYGVTDNQTDHERHLTAPMPGLVLKIEVSEGDSISKNDPLLVLEAMKMENEIRAPGHGIVASIHVEPGQAVAKGDILLDLSAEAPE